MSDDRRELLKALYLELYKLTQPVCQTKCNLPQSCCSPEYCEFAIDWAKTRWGTVLERTAHARLPLMGPSGCTATPHLRPMCTAHVCELTLYKQGPGYMDTYFALRSKIDELEWKIFEPKES